MKNFFFKLALILVGDLLATKYARKGMEKFGITSNIITQNLRYSLIKATARIASGFFLLIGLVFFFRFADYHMRHTWLLSDPEVSSIYFIFFSLLALIVAVLPRWSDPARKKAVRTPTAATANATAVSLPQLAT